MTEAELQPDNAVAVVVDRQFGDRLRDLAERLPVWIGTSETNRPVVEAVWAEHKARPSGYGVTIINASAEYSGEDLLFTQLDIIDEHHPSWSVIEVYGVARTPLLTEAFQEFGVTGFEDRADGFSASRSFPQPL